MTSHRLNLIVAYARNRTIGQDNKLPWKLPGDLAFFKRTTMGCPIIMGRKTWQSIGRPLPGRLNIVVTRDSTAQFEGATCVQSIAQAVALTQTMADVFVIGGAQLYADMLPQVDRIIATEIEQNIDGDATFAPLDPKQWRETSREPQPEENGLTYAFVTYERV
jgi:dihydrofolate reductase